MAENQFKVELGADDSQLRAALNESAKLLQNFTRQLQGLATTGKIDINTAPFQRAMKAGVALVDEFRTIAVDTAAKTQTSFQSITNSAESLETSLRSIPNAFDEVGASEAALQRINASIDASANSALQSSGKFQAFAQSIENSIAGFSATKESINQITASINRAGLAAIEAGENFLGLGVRMPIEDIKTLQGHVDRLQADIARGFKPIVNIVDPNTPVLLNRVSASLTNISPAAQLVSKSLADTGQDASRFAITLNKSIAASVQSFELFKREALELGSTFERMPTTLRFNTSAIVAARKHVADLNKEIAQIKGANITVIPTNTVKGVDNLTKSVSGVKKEFQRTNPVVGSFNQLLREAPAFTYSATTGFLALSNNLPIFAENFENALKSGRGFIGTLKDIGKSLFSFTSIVTIAGTLMAVFADKIFGAGKETEDTEKVLRQFKQTFGEAFVGGDIEKAKEQIESYQSALRQAIDSTAQEASKIALIVDRLQEGNTSRAETVQLIDELKKTAPDYFGKLDAEKSKIDDVVRAYANYNNALVQNIETQIKIAELTDVIKKRLEASTASPEAAQFIQEQLAAGKTLTQIYDQVGKRITESQRANLQMAQSGKIVTNEQLKQGVATQQNATAVLQLLGYYRDQERILNSINRIPKKKLGITDPDKKDDAELNRLNQELQALQTRIETINKLREAGVLPIHRENEALRLQLALIDKFDEIDEREVAIGIKPKLEIDPESSDFDIAKANEDYIKRIKAKFQVPVIVNAPVKVNAIINLPQANQPILEGFNDNIIEQIKGGQSAIQPEMQRYIGMIKAFGEDAADAITEAVRALENIPKTLGNGVVDAFVGIGEGIGEALAKGENPLVAAGQNFLKILGTVLQQVGKEVIIASKIVVALKAALNKAFSNPAASLAVGLALVIAGSALKNIKFNVPQFAEGGIANGPRSGYLAMLHGTEVITPIDKVGELATGAPVEVTGELILRGEDLRFALEATNKRRNRM